MSLGEWAEVAVKLLTSGSFVTLVLGLVAILVFRKPLRKALEKLKKLSIFGDYLHVELDPVATLAREAAEVVTPENGKAVEEMINSASRIGHALGEAGAPLPDWRFKWEGQEPRLTVTSESARATLTAYKESQRSSAMEQAIKRRIQELKAKK